MLSTVISPSEPKSTGIVSLVKKRRRPLDWRPLLQAAPWKLYGSTRRCWTHLRAETQESTRGRGQTIPRWRHCRLHAASATRWHRNYTSKKKRTVEMNTCAAKGAWSEETARRRLRLVSHQPYTLRARDPWRVFAKRCGAKPVSHARRPALAI